MPSQRFTRHYLELGVFVAVAVWLVGFVVLAVVAVLAPLLERCPWERPRRFVGTRKRVGTHHAAGPARTFTGKTTGSFRAVTS